MHPTYTTNHTEDFEQETEQFIIQSFITYINQQDPNQLNPNFEQELKQFMKYLNQKYKDLSTPSETHKTFNECVHTFHEPNGKD